MSDHTSAKISSETTGRTSAETAPTRPDPRIERTLAAVRQAATTLFLRSGYVGTSMNDIALAAGVSKRTLYNNYAHKEELFRDVVMAATGLADRFARDSVVELADPDDLPAALTSLARRLTTTVTSPQVVRLRRLLIGEAHRFPDLAAEYYDAAPGQVIATIASALEKLAASGHLHVHDATRAAEHFAFMVLGASLDRMLFSRPDARPDPETLGRAADDGVRAFLAAYGPQR